MKIYRFKRESNNFDDILNDIELKKFICNKLVWNHNLIIGLKYETKDSVISYMMLKYGEDILDISKDYTPIPYKDYTPIKK